MQINMYIRKIVCLIYRCLTVNIFADVVIIRHRKDRKLSYRRKKYISYLIYSRSVLLDRIVHILKIAHRLLDFLRMPVLINDKVIRY